MSDGIKIVLDSPSNSFYAGTNITGKVIVNFDKPKKARGLEIKIKGEAEVSWSKSESYHHDGERKTRSVKYHAEEEYFSDKYYLLGSSHGEINIPAGENVYPFTKALPLNLPSTFQGEYGHVRYSIKVTLDRPWKFDHEAKCNFFVITPVNLNNMATAKEQAKKEVHKSFCCCCCKSGPLTLVVWLPQKGYVPGQNIPVTIELDNVSNVDIENIICKIKKITKWTARIPKHDTKTETNDLIKLKLEGLEAGGSKTMTQTLTMPQMQSVNLDACGIIDVSFILKVTAEAGGCYDDLDAEVPLIIGSVEISEDAGPPGPPVDGGMNQSFVPQQNFAPLPPNTNPPYQQPFGPPGIQPYPSPGYAPPYPSPGAPYPGPTPYPPASFYPPASPYPPAYPMPGGDQAPPAPGFVAPPYPVPGHPVPYSSPGQPSDSPSAPMLQ